MHTIKTTIRKGALSALLLFLFAASLCGCTKRDDWTLTAEAAAGIPAETEEEEEEESTAAVTEAPLPAGKLISVHVCGAVKSAGVYRVPEDARIIDAVNAAGGLTGEACTEAVNLAAFLVDGCRVRIPSVAEADMQHPEAASTPVMTVGTDGRPVDGLVVLADGTADAGNKVNINTATAEELCTLNGVGPKRAQDIIRYREEHGAFADIQEIMQVPGIKQSLFAKLKDHIRV